MSRAKRSEARPRELADDALLDLVQRQTFRYFWDFAHPVSGLARERSNVRPDYGLETVTTGGSGFGVMAILVAAERGWIGRQEARDRLLRIVRFLLKADSYHGILPHFLNGETGGTMPFTRKDDGGDLVETSF
ncbi:MAG: glucoamylase family protein, partial [Burkholderiales bacterium]